MREEWRPILGYEGLYEVSSLGRVKSLNYNREKRQEILKQASDIDGYCLVSLSKNNKHKTAKVHRLVLQAFIGKSSLHINHKNKIKNDNRIENLEYCTPKYNTRYSCAKKVLQFTKNGKFIKEWNCIRDVEKELGINHSNISSCCKGKLYKSVGGYIWRYKEEFDYA